jgi:hypothetical protein
MITVPPLGLKVYDLFLTLHKFLSSDMADRLETVAFSGQMLDA